MLIVNNNLSYRLCNTYYRQGPRMCLGYKHRLSHLILTDLCKIFIIQQGQ